MGYETTRFEEGTVDDELVCSICGMVLENPVQVKQCEHAFCERCITEWIKHKTVCPIDRNIITLMDVIPAPRILRNLLGKLRITCDNSDTGCNIVISLENLQTHLDTCKFNPTRQVSCESGCGCMVEMRNLSSHNCLQTLGNIVREKDTIVNKLSLQIKDLKQVVADQNREIMLVKEMVRNLRQSSISAGLTSEAETERVRETVGWLSSISAAKITRWGGMISTPDTLLQAITKRALLDSGCPPYLTQELISNSHERRWPPGMSMLETRQANRHRYEEFIPKRIPNRQGVVIMACDNEHMGDNMIVEPGFIIIFAHGVE